MNDMSRVTIPRSDQINADSPLLPITVTVKGVTITGGQEQPVTIELVETPLYFRPCKSMSRVLVAAWGANAGKYAGRSMTLYCDPTVQFGGMAVGGIRISHMSHIEKAQTMALTASKAKRKPFTVQPLMQTLMDAATLIEAYGLAETIQVWNDIETDRAKAWTKIPTDKKPAVKAASDAAKVRIEAAPPAQQPEATL